MLVRLMARTLRAISLARLTHRTRPSPPEATRQRPKCWIPASVASVSVAHDTGVLQFLATPPAAGGSSGLHRRRRFIGTSGNHPSRRRKRTSRLSPALCVAVAFTCPVVTSAQQTHGAIREDALRVFLDCNTFKCDSEYFRTEIAFVNWVRDRTLAQAQSGLVALRHRQEDRADQAPAALERPDQEGQLADRPHACDALVDGRADGAVVGRRSGDGPDSVRRPGPPRRHGSRSESILSPSSAEARVNDVVEDRAESVAEPEAETRLVVGL